MSALRGLLFGLVLALLAALVAAASRPPADLVPEVALADLRHNPARWVGTRVRLRAQLASTGRDVDPMETPFDPALWQRFELWSVEQRPWKRADYFDPARYLFAPKGSTAALLLDAGEPHRAFDLVCTVRALRLGEPWIAIEQARPLPESIGEGTVLHASRAEELRLAGSRRLAAVELEQALLGGMPEWARLEIEADLSALRADLEARPELGPPAPRPGEERVEWRLKLVSPRTTETP